MHGRMASESNMLILAGNADVPVKGPSCAFSSHYPGFAPRKEFGTLRGLNWSKQIAQGIKATEKNRTVIIIKKTYNFEAGEMTQRGKVLIGQALEFESDSQHKSQVEGRRP